MNWIKIKINFSFFIVSFMVAAICYVPQVFAEISSIQKIQKAFKESMIDYETSLVYKLKSVLRPSEVPKRFMTCSGRPIRSATMLIVEVRENWDKLSKHAQDELSKILSRPSDLLLPDTFPSASGNFLLHYTKTGSNQVYGPTLDSDLDGVPDYVEDYAAYFDHSYDIEIDSMAYQIPQSDGTQGGDSRYDIYIKDLYNDNECEGCYGYTDYVGKVSYIVVENDFVGYPSNYDPEGFKA